MTNVASIPAPAAPIPQVVGENNPVPDEKKAENSQLESTRFAHLAKKESELVKRQEEIKRQREEFLKDKEQVDLIKTKATEFESLKEKDPIAALKMLGFTETQLFNYLSEQNLSPEQKAEKAAMSKIQEFEDRQKKAQEEQVRLQAEAEAKRDQEAISSFKQTINQQIQKEKDKYEYVAFHGPVAEELVFNTIEEIFTKENKVVPLHEALQLVEDYYEGLDKEMTEKVQKRKPKEEAVAEAKEKLTEALRPEVNPMPQKTLSNKATATSASQIPRPETRDQKRQRLIQQLGSLGKK